MIYTIKVFRKDGSELTSELASHPSLDAGRVEDRPVGSLAVLTADECRVALGQIIDMGHEWGSLPDTHIEGLHARAASIVDSGYTAATFEVPDGWTIGVRRASNHDVQETASSLVRGARDAYRADNVTDAFGHLTRAVAILVDALADTNDTVDDLEHRIEDADNADDIERLERNITDLESRLADLED